MDMMMLFVIFIGILFLEMIFGFIGFMIKMCFYLSPFGLMYLLFRAFTGRRYRMYRRFYF